MMSEMRENIQNLESKEKDTEENNEVGSLQN